MIIFFWSRIRKTSNLGIRKNGHLLWFISEEIVVCSGLPDWSMKPFLGAVDYTLIFTDHVTSKLWTPFHLTSPLWLSTLSFYLALSFSCLFLFVFLHFSLLMSFLSLFYFWLSLWSVPACSTPALGSHTFRKSKGQCRRMEAWPFRCYLARRMLPKSSVA